MHFQGLQGLNIKNNPRGRATSWKRGKVTCPKKVDFFPEGDQCGQKLFVILKRQTTSPPTGIDAYLLFYSLNITSY